MRDREEENTIKQLKGDNEKLVNIVANQKATIEEHIGNSVDPKNIRGIE